MSGIDLNIRVLPVGAEVLGFDAGREHEPRARDTLYRAWLEHGILLFKGIDSIERHLDISRCFGELEIHPFPAVRSELNPLLIELAGKKRVRAYVFDGDPDEAIVWDNRRFLHAARGNLLSEPRWGLRTTLAGALRTGRYFEEGATERALEIAD